VVVFFILVTSPVTTLRSQGTYRARSRGMWRRNRRGVLFADARRSLREQAPARRSPRQSLLEQPHAGGPCPWRRSCRVAAVGTV